MGWGMNAGKEWKGRKGGWIVIVWMGKVDCVDCIDGRDVGRVGKWVGRVE